MFLTLQRVVLRHFTTKSLSATHAAGNAFYTEKLLKLCRKGRVNDGLVVIDEMIENKIDLSHYNFSALIHGCIQSKQPERYKSIWDNFINKYNVSPNHITYSLAISAASRCNDTVGVKELSDELLRNYLSKMDLKTWNQLIDSFGRINDINSMLSLFNTMEQETNCVPDGCTISCLLNACIKS